MTKQVNEKMKKGISIWSFQGEPLEQVFGLAAKHGYEGVELGLSEDGPITEQTTEAEAHAIRELADQAGVQIVGLATALYWNYPLTSDDETVRARSVSLMRKQLQIAAWLAVDTILVLAGSVTGGEGGRPYIPYDVAWQRSIDGIRAVLPAAEAAGVQIAIENVWNNYLMSPLEMRNLVDAINHPLVGVYLDSGNMKPFGHPEDWIQVLGKRIQKVHFKDFAHTSQGAGFFCNLLEGHVNWPEVMKALRETGYTDWVTAEITPFPMANDVQLTTTSLAMDKILGM